MLPVSLIPDYTPENIRECRDITVGTPVFSDDQSNYKIAGAVTHLYNIARRFLL
jgi:hypothetical protein